MHHEDLFPVVVFGSTPTRLLAALATTDDLGIRAILPTCEGNLSSFSQACAGRLFHSLALPSRPSDSDLKKAVQSLNAHFGERWGTFALDDYICETSAALSSLGGVATFPRHAAFAALHKDRLRKQWNELAADDRGHLVPVENSLLSFDRFDVPRQEIARRMKQFPRWETASIIKPNALASSIEVHRVDSFDAGLEVVESILSILAAHQEFARSEGILLSPDILVEEAIPRRPEPAEYSVEVLSIHGEHTILGLTEKCIDPETYIELGHAFPATTFPTSLETQLAAALRRMLDGLEVQNCFSHWEFIVTPSEQIAMVEGQLRPGGDHIPTLCQLATGRDPHHVFFDGVSRGTDALPSPPPSRTAIFRALAPETPLHRVEEVVQPQAIGEDERLFISEDEIRAEELWSGPTNWRNRFVVALTTGATQGEALDRCAALASSVRLRGVDKSGQPNESRLVVGR